MVDVDVNAAMDEEVSADLIKAAQEADLIEGGRYRFQVETAERVENMKEFFDEEQTRKNPFYGKNVYNLRMRLTAKRDGKDKKAPFVTLDRPRTHFQKVTAATVLNSRGELSTESVLFGQMAGIYAKATGEKPTVGAVLGYFSDNAAEIHITKSEEAEKNGVTYAAKNWVRGVKAITE
jgi:hypothetical protein